VTVVTLTAGWHAAKKLPKFRRLLARTRGPPLTRRRHPFPRVYKMTAREI